MNQKNNSQKNIIMMLLGLGVTAVILAALFVFVLGDSETDNSAEQVEAESEGLEAVGGDGFVEPEEAIEPYDDSINVVVPESDSSEPSGQDEESDDIDLSQSELHIISITNEGYSPAVLRIKQGDVVKFINNSDSSNWPASDDHPTHQIYPAFDPGQALGPGVSHNIPGPLTRIGEWGYHDHLNPSVTGTIVVEAR